MSNNFGAGGTANDPSGGIFTGGGRNSIPGQNYMRGFMTPSEAEVKEMMNDPTYRNLFLARKGERQVGAQPAPRPPANPVGQNQTGRNPRLADIQKNRMANSRALQPEDDKVFETAIDSGNRQISMQVVKIKVPFHFTFCPADMAATAVDKARALLTFHLQDILKYYISSQDKSISGVKGSDQLAIFEKCWTLSQIVLQDTCNTSHLPMCLRVSIVRPSTTDISQNKNGIEILPQNTVTGIPGEPPCTTIVWPTGGKVMEKTSSIRPERTKFVRSFLQDRCPTKTVGDVCRVLAQVPLVGTPGYKLRHDDPVCIYIIDNAREDALREMEGARPMPKTDEDLEAWNQEFNTLLAAKIEESMESNSREEVYYVPVSIANEHKAWIISNANEVITGSDLFSTPNHPTSGCTISVWPFVKLSGVSNEKSTAAVFDVNNSNFAKIKSVSSNQSDIDDVGKEWQMVHGTLVLSFLRPLSQGF